MADAVLELAGVHAGFVPGVAAVRGVSLTLIAGRTLALVGESGSGKTALALALLRLLPPRGWTRAERLRVCGVDVPSADPRALCGLRGGAVGFVFQEPLTALSPMYTVGAQVEEAIRAHERVPRAVARDRAVALLEEVGLDQPPGRYPHQLSGGQRQRAVIAAALACAPRLLIADEPTTALDVTVQAQVLALLRTLCERRGMAMLFVTHDLAVAAEVADELAVMQAGVLVEQGPIGEVLRAPRSPYTAALLGARARLRDQAGPSTGSGAPAGRVSGARGGSDPAPGAGAHPALEVEHLVVQHPVRGGLLRGVTGQVRAVDDVSFSLPRGRTLGVVGESGSGKSTLARAIVRLCPSASGAVRLGGVELLSLDPPALRRARRAIQLVFQDPGSSLDPHWTMAGILTEPLRVHGVGSDPAAWRERAAALCAEVGLDPDCLDRHPHALSGGQRQRVAIARALAPGPDVLVCDEPVSALDVSIQAQILDLLRALQDRHGLAMLFISHDLSVIRALADEVLVMRAGRVVESGPVDEIFARPQHAYTRQLLEAIPDDDLDRLDARLARRAAWRASPRTEFSPGPPPRSP